MPLLSVYQQKHINNKTTPATCNIIRVLRSQGVLLNNFTTKFYSDIFETNWLAIMGFSL